MTVPLLPTLGVPELLIILVIVVIFFGVGKLPSVLRSMGEGVKAFRDGAQGTSPEEESAKGEIDVTPTAEKVKEAEEIRRS